MLKENKLEHVVSTMDKAPSALAKLQESAGHKTVPLIFKVNGENEYSFVGGCDDLKGSLDDGNSKESASQTAAEEGQAQ